MAKNMVYMSLKRKASKVFSGQLQRCYNENNPSYKYYGKKGIVVEYKREQFTNWFVLNYKEKRLKVPNVGRINHSDNYRFGNIELIELSDNVKERNKRMGNPIPPKKVTKFCLKNKKIIKKYNSCLSASIDNNVHVSSISKVCLGLLKQLRGYGYCYMEVNHP